MEGASQIVCTVLCADECVHVSFVYVSNCVYICMQRGLGNIRHCLIYCSKVAIAGWDPLHLSPFLNGISTASTPTAVSHFNDWRNDCVCVSECLCTCIFFPLSVGYKDRARLPVLLFVKTKQHQQYFFS